MSTVLEPTQVIVVQQPQTTVSVKGGGAVQITQDSQTNVIVTPGPKQIIEIAQQGPPGPPGQGAVLQGICGALINIGTVVISSGNRLYPADPTNPTHAIAVLGVATQTGQINDQIEVAQSGQINISGIFQDAQYFVGLNGVLSTTTIAPGAVWFRYIGLGTAANSLTVVNSFSVNLPN